VEGISNIKHTWNILEVRSDYLIVRIDSTYRAKCRIVLTKNKNKSICDGCSCKYFDITLALEAKLLLNRSGSSCVDIQQYVNIIIHAQNLNCLRRMRKTSDCVCVFTGSKKTLDLDLLNLLALVSQVLVSFSSSTKM
jgi:hypothetical protein